MLILSVPAILIGIACSLILIVAMKVAALLQRVLWSNLPAQLGVSADSPLWVIAMLTAVALGLATDAKAQMFLRIRNTSVHRFEFIGDKLPSGVRDEFEALKQRLA